MAFGISRWIGAIVVASTVGSPVAVWAADASDASTVAASSSSSLQEIPEIIVTSRKRVESVEKVPVAVTVVSQDALVQHQISDGYELVKLTPSLQVEATTQVPGAVNFSIRGIGSAFYGADVESSVGIVIDDVVMSRPQFGAVQYFDFDRVEVLRGPQGMLFGINASAGVINISTATPKLGEYDFLSHVEYGHDTAPDGGNLARVDAAGNIPIGSNAALRFAVFSSREDGFMENVNTHEDLGNTQYGGRVKFLWEPTDSIRLFLSGDYQRGSGPAETVLSRSFDAPGGLIQSLDAAAGITASSLNTKLAGAARTEASTSVGGVSFKSEFDIGGGYTITNIAGYRMYENHTQVDTDSVPEPLFDVNGGLTHFNQDTDELRLTSPTSSRLSFQAGLFYLNFRSDGYLLQGGDLGIPVPPPKTFIGGYGEGRVGAKSYAAFGEAQFKLTESLRLTAGGRQTHDFLSNFSLHTNPLSLVALYPDQNQYQSLTANNFSYRVGVDYDIAPDILGYFTFARGYKGPTFGAPAYPVVKAEIPISYELGVKATMLDRRLQLNVAVFDTTFDNFQTQAQAPGEATGFIPLNAGKLVTRGAEVEFTALPLPGLTVSGGTTYNFTEYRDLVGYPCYYAEPTGTSGTNVCLANNTQEVSGNQLANAPRWTTSVTARYERPVMTDRWLGFIQGDVYDRSGFNFTATKDPHTYVGSSAILGASLGVHRNDNGLSVSLFVHNMLDKRVPTFVLQDVLAGIYTGSSGKNDVQLGGDYWHEFNANSFRTVGLALDMKF